MLKTGRISAILMLVMALTLLGWSCKKKRAFNEEDAQETADDRFALAEIDEVIKDVNTVVLEQYLLRGRPEFTGSRPGGNTSVCGAALDTTKINSGIVTITYTGLDCFGRLRSGKVKFSLLEYPLKKWKHQGANIKVELIGYTMQRSYDGKSIKVEGTFNMFNESGGSWYDLWYLNEPTLKHGITGENLRVTFNKLDVIKFSFNRWMNFTYASGITTCRVEAAGSADGHSGLDSWGLSREGEKYYSEVLEPYVWKTSCGAVALISGRCRLLLDGKTHEMNSEYGTDEAGNSLGGQSDPCPYGWKVKITFKNKERNLIFSYY